MAVRPGAKLDSILRDLETRPDVKEVLEKHLLGGTGASTLARDLTDSGYPVGATTIKAWRQANRDESGLV